MSCTIWLKTMGTKVLLKCFHSFPGVQLNPLAYMDGEDLLKGESLYLCMLVEIIGSHASGHGKSIVLIVLLEKWEIPLMEMNSNMFKEYCYTGYFLENSSFKILSLRSCQFSCWKNPSASGSKPAKMVFKKWYWIKLMKRLKNWKKHLLR